MSKIISMLCVLLPSGITCFLMRLCGYKIGKNTRIPLFSFISAKTMEIGNDVEIMPFVYINVGNLSIGSNTLISYGSQIKGDTGFITGDNCFIGPHCIIHCAQEVKFGFYSGVGPRCTIYTHGSFLPVTKGFPAKFDTVLIGDYVWVCMSVTILAGARLESNCIIYPGVVVASRIKSDSIIQIDSTRNNRLDLKQLQTFSKKDNTYHQETILTSFLTSMNFQFTHEKERHEYKIDKVGKFLYFPEENRVLLEMKGGKKISYDFENYYTDCSKQKIHKSFLFYLRRRYGLTLRSRYK